MTRNEAIEQLVRIRENLKRYSNPNMTRETREFKLRSIEAIDVILEELKRSEVPA